MSPKRRSLDPAEPAALPWVTVAAVCENLLQEKDNVFAVVRVVDRFNIHTPSEIPPGAAGKLAMNAMVAVKAGDAPAGHHVIRIVINYPNGTTKPLPDFPCELNGDPAHGYTLGISLDLEVKEFGLHWFDVLWDEQVLTRIPFTIGLAEKPIEME